MPVDAQTPASVEPNDPWWAEELGLAQIGAPALWGLTEGSPSSVIAIVDTGVNAASPDLAGAVLPGWNAVDGSSNVADDVGHGTMVATIAAGRGNNHVQGTGVCWRCSILPVKVTDATGSATGARLASGIVWAANHGANVINISLVLGGPDDAVAQAVEYAHARGAVVVAAAGNNGGSAPTYPASYPDVIGVAAIDPADRLYPWSSHGPWAAVAAPGCAPVGNATGGPVPFCGSSAAAPLVAGLAGLLWSHGLSSNAAIESALESTAQPLGAEVAAAGVVDATRLAAAVTK